MKPEYSFFRAEGESLAAVETCGAAKKAFEALKEKLRAKYGATEIGWRRDETGRVRIRSFIFLAPAKPPEGWEQTRSPQMNHDNSAVLAEHAMPPKGAPEHLQIAAVAGLMDRAGRSMRLEDVFASGEMPMKDFPAGRYSNRFARQTSLDDADEKRGVIQDGVTMCTYSNSRCSGSDPLDAAQLNGAWYIRVPNKKGTEEPVFIPPGAKRVPYADILVADRNENIRRNNPPRGRSFPGIH